MSVGIKDGSTDGKVREGEDGSCCDVLSDVAEEDCEDCDVFLRR